MLGKIVLIKCLIKYNKKISVELINSNQLNVNFTLVIISNDWYYYVW